MIRTRVALALTLALGCRRPPLAVDAAGDASAPRDAARAPTAQRRWAPSRDAGARADLPSLRVEGDAAAPEPGAVPTGVGRVVRTRAGAVAVWTRAVSEGTALVAQRLDADGRAVGAPLRLATVRGLVEAMDADARGGALWVAWVSDKGSQGRWMLRETGVLTASDDLAAVRAPTTLSDLRVWPVQRRWTRRFAEVRAGDDGTAVILASADNYACPLSVVTATGHANWVDCAGWQWLRVGLDHRVTAEGRGSMARPEFAPASLTRVQGGWLFARGPVDGVSAARVVIDPAGHRALPGGGTTSRVLPAFLDTISLCDHPRVAWTGGAFVARCEPDASVGEPEGSAWVRVVRGDGTAATTARNTVARVTGEVLRCVDGRPSVELRWEGGSVRLDPARPDGSLRFEQWDGGGVLDGVDAAAWAGRVIVGVDARAGRIRRWGCDARGELAPLE